MLARIPRLLDVKPGRKQWDPKIAEMLRLLPAEVERQMQKNNNQQKGESNEISQDQK
jgi:hypothetical protein